MIIAGSFAFLVLTFAFGINGILNKMAKKLTPKEGSEIIRNCIKRGWERRGDKVLSPAEVAHDPIKPTIRKIRIVQKTGWIDDSRNLKNKDVNTDMFDRLIEIELGIQVWHEFRFSIERAYRLDKAFPVDSEGNVLKIGIEVSGGLWMDKSGHNTGKAIKRDQDKNSLALTLGWRVISVEPSEIKNNPGKVINMIKELIKQTR